MTKTFEFDTRVPQSICSCLPGYQIWMLRTYSGMYPGTHRLYTLGSPRIRPGCFGHYHVCTRVSNQSICCDRVSNLRCFGHTRICTRVHTLGVPGYQTCMFRSYSGMLVEHVIWAKESLTFRTREQVHFFTGIMLLMGDLVQGGSRISNQGGSCISNAGWEFHLIRVGFASRSAQEMLHRQGGGCTSVRVGATSQSQGGSCFSVGVRVPSQSRCDSLRGRVRSCFSPRVRVPSQSE